MNGFVPYNGAFVAGYSAQGYYSAPSVYPSVVSSWPVFPASPIQVARKSPQAASGARPPFRPPPPPKDTEVDLKLLRIELGAFYNAHNPGQVPKIPSIIQDFADRGGTKEELVYLNMDLRDKYGADLESVRSAESKRSRESYAHSEAPYHATIQSSAPYDATVQSAARVSLSSAEYFLPRNRLFDDSTAETPYSQGASTRVSLPYSSQGSIKSAASSGCLHPSPTPSNGISPSVPASDSFPVPYDLHRAWEQSPQQPEASQTPPPHVHRVRSPNPEPSPPQVQALPQEKTEQRRDSDRWGRSESGVVAVAGRNGQQEEMVAWRMHAEEMERWDRGKDISSEKAAEVSQPSRWDRSESAVRVVEGRFGKEVSAEGSPTPPPQTQLIPEQTQPWPVLDRDESGVVAAEGDAGQMVVWNTQREAMERVDRVSGVSSSEHPAPTSQLETSSADVRSERDGRGEEGRAEHVSPAPQTPAMPTPCPLLQSEAAQMEAEHSAWMGATRGLSVEQLKAASLSPQHAGHAAQSLPPSRAPGTHNLLEVLLLPSPSLSSSTKQAALQAWLSLDGQQVQSIACGGGGLDARAGVGTVSFEVSDSVNLLALEIWEGAESGDGRRGKGRGVCWGRAEVALPELLQGGRHTIVTSQAHQTLITTNQVQLHLEPVAVAEGGRSSERRGAEDVAVHVRVKYGSGHPIPRNDFRRVLTMFEGNASGTGEHGGSMAETEQMEASFGTSTGSYHAGAVEGLQSADRILQAISAHLQPSGDADRTRGEEKTDNDFTAARIEELRLQLQEQRRIFGEQAREKEENKEVAWKALVKAQAELQRLRSLVAQLQISGGPSPSKVAAQETL